MAALNSIDRATNPSVAPDGLTIRWSSTRNTHADFEIYVSTRATPTALWDTPVPAAELNTAEPETDAWLSPDTRYMMFTRGTVPGEIYQASPQAGGRSASAAFHTTPPGTVHAGPSTSPGPSDAPRPASPAPPDRSLAPPIRSLAPP